MSESLTDSLIGLYRGLFADAAANYPTLHKDFERDLLRLETLSSTMGIKVFTLMLPALGKVLDSSFQTGRLVFDGIPLSRSVNRRTVIPRLFRGFWSRIAEPDGCLKRDIDPLDVGFLRTFLYAAKKLRMDCPSHAVFATVAEYYDVDQTLPPTPELWKSDGQDSYANPDRSLLDLFSASLPLFSPVFSTGEDGRLLHICQRVADRVSTLLGEFSPREARFRHGPGAVADLRTGREYKYSFPSWGRRLQWVFPAVEFAFANSSLAEGSDNFDESLIKLVEPSSTLHAVPKTQKGPRLIAAEPTAHQWCQQAVRSSLDLAIQGSCIGDSIDFRRQDLSGALALTASADGSLATIDLSSASDRLSCYVVDKLFRRNPSYLAAFVASRTRFLQQTIDKKSPKLYELRKFASMGSALTFPVQSLVFYMVCVAAGVATTNSNISDWASLAKSVRVYGDDLIVPVSWVPIVDRMLTLLSLKINRSKTFTDGNFRESCGTDAFKGTSVSPGQILQFYDESAPSSLQGLVDASNNFYMKGFWHAASALVSPLPRPIARLIPKVAIGSGAFGLQTACGNLVESKVRYNFDLYRWEYQTWKFVSKSSRTQRHESFANLLQYFTEDPTSTELALWESGVFAKPLTVTGKGWEPIFG